MRVTSNEITSFYPSNIGSLSLSLSLLSAKIYDKGATFELTTTQIHIVVELLFFFFSSRVYESNRSSSKWYARTYNIQYSIPTIPYDEHHPSSHFTPSELTINIEKIRCNDNIAFSPHLLIKPTRVLYAIPKHTMCLSILS